MTTTDHHDSAGRRQLALAARRLERKGWTFDGLRIAEILERIDGEDDELFAQLLDACNGGDEHAGTVALYSILPRLVAGVEASSSGRYRGRALDEMLGFAWIVIKDTRHPIERERSIHLVVNRVRFRARRSVNPYRADRPHLATRELLRSPELFNSIASRDEPSKDPTADAVMRRIEVERIGEVVGNAIRDGVIDAENWTALIDSRVLCGHTPKSDHRTLSGTRSAVWRTTLRIRSLAEEVA